MKTRIFCLAPGRATPGMTLATAITAHDGLTLLASGTVLNSEMLDRLVRRGVETVAVFLPDARAEETIAMELRAAESRVEHIFRGHGSPAREALRTAILNFRQERAK